MSAPAVAPIIADVEQPRPIESPAIIDQSTWRAAILASVIVVFCLIACFAVINWMCCVG